MTSERVSVIGTGLIGTSVAMAAARLGSAVSGWDPDPRALATASEISGLSAAKDLVDACSGAELVVVAGPVSTLATSALAALELPGGAVVTDVGSVKAPVIESVNARAAPEAASRFVGGHPMGGSERSGPSHASEAVIDGIVWVLTPSERTDAKVLESLEAWVSRLGARPIVMTPSRHDRLVAIVSHLPQVASTTLMSLAATEESDEPDILMLAAGGFRDLTRLAASNPEIWSSILLSNSEALLGAIDLYLQRLRTMRDLIGSGREEELRRAFGVAKEARLAMSAKPQVRSGISVILVPVPDRPGSLAELTAALAEGGVNIEDLQIVHSAEGGRGTVHLSVASSEAEHADSVLAGSGFDPTRLA
jgi:prephenate dehydrogenase